MPTFEPLSELRLWYENISTPLTVDLRESPDYPKRSAWVTIEGSRRIARISVWETGEAELSRAEIETGIVQPEHRDFISTDEVAQAATDLLAWVEAVG